MTSPKAGKHDTRIQNFEKLMTQDDFIQLRAHAQGISMFLTIGLTIYLAYRDQYLYSLFGAALTLAAATSDRLKRIRISLHGLHAEWCVGGQGTKRSRLTPPGSG